MATQFVCLASLHFRTTRKKKFTPEKVSPGDGSSLTNLLPTDHRSSSCGHKDVNDCKSGNGPASGNGEKVKPPNKTQKRKRGRRGWARKLQPPRSSIGFWYMASSISYILRKARAFYNEFCCDNFADPNPIMGHRDHGGLTVVTLADPYFSLPVIPPPTINIAPYQ